MSLLSELKLRSENRCELCTSTQNLSIYELKPISTGGVDGSVLACNTCISQIENEKELNRNHWRCLNESIWSEFSPVKVISWRMLHRLKDEGWPKDLLEMMYLTDNELNFAKESGDHLEESDKIIHRDVNGVVLQSGDNVVLIKDLKVKGSSMVAKQGTTVRRISLDDENEKYIEGKVGATQIVIITEYVKKVNEKE